VDEAFGQKYQRTLQFVVDALINQPVTKGSKPGDQGTNYEIVSYIERQTNSLIISHTRTFVFIIKLRISQGPLKI
jgi:hypothetical protein